MRKDIRARQVTTGMVVSMHGKPQRIIEIKFPTQGRIKLVAEKDSMFVGRSTTLTHYLDG